MGSPAEKHLKPGGHLLILGTGALATLFAARLAQAGVKVSMLGSWPEGMQALKTHGASLLLPDGNRISQTVHIWEGQPPGKVKQVLVLVKSWQTVRAAQQLGPILDTDGLVLTLQNGLGNREILVQALGETRVAQGVTTSGGTLLEPGLVRLGGEGAVSLEDHPHIAPMAEMLKQAGFEVHLVNQVESLVWGKLVVNSAINPLSAILRLPNGALLENPSRRLLLGEVAQETARVAQAKGINLPFDDPRLAAETVAQRTASNRSSMLQDVLRGAPTEIESISGAIHRLGQELSVSTPYNTSLYWLVKSISTG